ncbi:MAG: hypothetical protein M5R40_29595 [Anaerolineae bacterium]|nr:hypothetical protein [Anaerolineae bacterium]
MNAPHHEQPLAFAAMTATDRHGGERVITLTAYPKHIVARADLEPFNPALFAQIVRRRFPDAYLEADDGPDCRRMRIYVADPAGAFTVEETALWEALRYEASQRSGVRAVQAHNTRRVPLDLLQRLLQCHARAALSPYLDDARLREHARFAEELSRAIHGEGAPEEDEPEQEEVDG